MYTKCTDISNKMQHTCIAEENTWLYFLIIVIVLFNKYSIFYVFIYYDYYNKWSSYEMWPARDTDQNLRPGPCRRRGWTTWAAGSRPRPRAVCDLYAARHHCISVAAVAHRPARLLGLQQSDRGQHCSGSWRYFEVAGHHVASWQLRPSQDRCSGTPDAEGAVVPPTWGACSDGMDCLCCWAGVGGHHCHSHYPILTPANNQHHLSSSQTISIISQTISVISKTISTQNWLKQNVLFNFLLLQIIYSVYVYNNNLWTYNLISASSVFVLKQSHFIMLKRLKLVFSYFTSYFV